MKPMLLAMAAALICAPAYAADTSTAAPAPKAKSHHRHRAVHRVAKSSAEQMIEIQQQKIDALTKQLQDMQQQQAAMMSQMKQVQQQVTAKVEPPATGVPPQGLSQHVGLVEQDLGNLKKDLSDNLGIHVHGLVDAGYEYNINQPNTAGGSGCGGNCKGGSNVFATGGSLNQLRVFDPNANSFALNQGNIHIDRTKDGGVGFVLDLNFGNVANVLGQSTRYTNINPAGASNTIVDPTQFYLTYTVPVGTGINLQAGRFATLLGAEVIPVYNNLNYNETRSLNFGFAIPFTHTGIRAQYQFNDYVGATVGVNNGWDDISDNNDGKTIEGELALNNKDKSLALALNGIWGAEQVNRGSSKRLAIDPIITYKPSFFANTTLIGEYTYGHETGPVSVFPATTSYPDLCGSGFGNNLACLPANANGGYTINHAVQWNSVAGYFIYDWSDALEFATRGEWFSDPDGARTGLKQNLGEITQTISYKIPHVDGLLTRLEYRHDESNSNPFFSNQAWMTTKPFLPGRTHDGQDTLTAALIYTF
jgi:putative OmpL-like beta-barrel porin-2